MRMLFTTNPMHGHANTLVPLALAAQAAGHDVIVATGADHGAAIARHGLAVRGVGATHAELGGNRQDSWFAYFERAAACRVEGLLDLCDAWTPHVVVHEETEMSGPVAAQRCGVPALVHGLGLNPPLRFGAALRAALQRVGAPWGAADVAEAVLEAPYLRVTPPSLVLRDEGGSCWHDVRPIRHAAGLAAPDERLPREIDALPHERTAYVTSGTVYNGEHEALARTVRALRGLPLNLVVTVGSGVDPAVLGPQPPHLLVARQIPQRLLLPRCCLVVSHGGAGTLLGALAHGLPQLAMPRGADQFLNADALEDSGAGLQLRAPYDSEAAIESAARRLLQDGGFATRARHLRREIEAMPSAAEVVEAITRGCAQSPNAACTG